MISPITYINNSIYQLITSRLNAIEMRKLSIRGIVKEFALLLQYMIY
jgi:hypothetical protein